MYGTEAYIAWFLIFICSYVAARVLVSCFIELSFVGLRVLTITGKKRKLIK